MSCITPYGPLKPDLRAKNNGRMERQTHSNSTPTAEVPIMKLLHLYIEKRVRNLKFLSITQVTLYLVNFTVLKR